MRIRIWHEDKVVLSQSSVAFTMRHADTKLLQVKITQQKFKAKSTNSRQWRKLVYKQLDKLESQNLND